MLPNFFMCVSRNGADKINEEFKGLKTTGSFNVEITLLYHRHGVN